MHSLKASVDCVPDHKMQLIAGLVDYLDCAQVPPMAAAAAVRGCLGDKDLALRLFKDGKNSKDDLENLMKTHDNTPFQCIFNAFSRLFNGF